MSYDIDFMMDTGGSEPSSVADFNHTYNCGPMFRKALGGDGLHDLNEQSAESMIPLLRAAVADIEQPANLAGYTALNPSNGWGNVESATELLKELLAAAIAHPKTTIRVT